MAVFPLFVDLKGKKCVVVGGGKVATRKVETLLRFDTQVVVVSPEVSERIQELKWKNSIVVLKKEYSEEDIDDAFLVVAATADRKTNEKIYEDAAARKIFVNVVDNPQNCTFIFPSVVTRKDLVIGISTSGSYPALSKKTREKIENTIPETYNDMVEVLKKWRERAEREIAVQDLRKQFLNRILDEILFFENAVTQERMEAIIEDIFREYKDE